MPGKWISGWTIFACPEGPSSPKGLKMKPNPGSLWPKLDKISSHKGPTSIFLLMRLISQNAYPVVPWWVGRPGPEVPGYSLTVGKKKCVFPDQAPMPPISVFPPRKGLMKWKNTYAMRVHLLIMWELFGYGFIFTFFSNHFQSLLPPMAYRRSWFPFLFLKFLAYILFFFLVYDTLFMLIPINELIFHRSTQFPRKSPGAPTFCFMWRPRCWVVQGAPPPIGPPFFCTAVFGL